MANTLKHTEKGALLGDEDHLELSQNISFPEMIFRLLSEKKPTPEQLKVFELILNLSIDHGPDAPSAAKTIEEAKAGKTVSEAVASGIEQINDAHGGAIEPAMEFFNRVQRQESRVKDLVKEYFDADKKIPGFGHRIYKESDPRAQLILKTLEEQRMDYKYTELAMEIENEIFSIKDKVLPLNIDGAIAVALCTFGWDPKLGKAVFIIARTPGLCAHFLNNS